MMIERLEIMQVASRRITQMSAMLMLFMAMFGKFGALFTTIPEPIIGGMFLVMFGIIAAIGLSLLQDVDMSSSRNIFIIGCGLCFGIAVPYYFINYKPIIDTGIVRFVFHITA